MDGHQISPQYLTKNQITVTILDVIDPAHYVVKETPDLLNASSEANNFLEAEDAMQKYYASVQPCFFQLPLKDSIIVVFYKEKFYRAKVINILTMSAGHLFKVYCVDYGMECSVSRDCIYEIEYDFLNHPFQAIDMKLYGIEPISMKINPVDLSISYGPASHWDDSAMIHIRDLQKGMCNAYIEVQGIDGQSVYGKLYVCYESIPMICINDELISKSFAQINEDNFKNVQKLENFLQNPAIETACIGTAKLVTPPKLNPEQMFSHSNCSEFGFKDFKTMFINPSDGKVVAESTFSNNSCLETPLEVEDNAQSQFEASSRKEAFSESLVTSGGTLMSPSKVEEEPSPMSETQRTFLKLQQLNRRKRLSASSSNNADSANPKNSPPLAMSKTVVRNSTVEHCMERTDKSSLAFASPSSEKNLNGNNVKNSSKSNVFSNCDNSKSSNEIQTRSQDIPKQENITQSQLMAQKTFQKLQQLNRKKLQSSVHSSTTGLPAVTKSLPVVTKRMSIEKETIVSAESLSERQPTVESEKSSFTDSKLYSSNLYTQKCQLQASKVTDHAESKHSANCTSPEQLKHNSLSPKSLEEKLIAEKRFLKLQQLSRRKLQSFSVSGITDPPAAVKSSAVVTENTSREKETPVLVCSKSPSNKQATIENEKSSLCKLDISNADSQKCQLQASKVTGQSASKNNAKQESTSQVKSENVKTFEKLKSRMQKMKELQSSEKTSCGVKQIEGILQDKCSVPCSSSEPQKCNSSLPKSSEELLKLE